MYRAIGVEPTKLIALTSGWCSNASTATLSPCTTLKTPSGKPACLKNSAIKSATEGSRSDGLRMNVLPDAIAIANIQAGTIIGKLNGVIPAQTPSGWRIEYVSTVRETFSLNWPLSACGNAHAKSMTSSARATSPSASCTILPCSLDTILARSSECFLTSSRRPKSTSARLPSGVRLQAGKALRAT